MKKLSLIIVFFICTFSLNAQTPFKVEKIDTVSKTKAQIYSDTKMFIAEYWKSAQNVIQNDDKEAGVILIKGTLVIDHKINFAAVFSFTYSYNIKFFMKEGKCRILIEDVICINSTNNSNRIKPNLIQLDEPQRFNMSCNVSEKKTEEIKERVKNEMSNIAIAYIAFIKKPSVTNENW
jgi:hypothetical protein